MKKVAATLLASVLSFGVSAQTGSGWWMPNAPNITIKLTPLEVCSAYIQWYDATYPSQWQSYSPDVVPVDVGYPAYECQWRTTNPYITQQPLRGGVVRDAFPGCEQYGCRND